MVKGGNPLELSKRGFPISSIVEKVAEIDASFMKIGVETECPPEMAAPFHFVPQTMEAIGESGYRFRHVRPNRNGLGENIPGLRIEPLSIEGPAHGQHQLYILVETHGLHFAEVGQSFILLPKSEEDFPHAY
jgi:hypothetical protein